PLARGTRGAGNGAKIYRRFIPAGAGNTIIRCAFRENSAVYPRWRGEHQSIAQPSNAERGLSP
ncbi:hypothetical protein HMPREF9534_05593, partial [Escherichia coli MS 69-1]